jgi:hypothetical protein
MEFNMLTIKKQDSILIAVTLAIILSVPQLVLAFYGLSTITLPDHASDRLGHLSEQNDVSGDYGNARSHRPGLECDLFSGFPI